MMTTGTFMFFSGVGLLFVTIILGVVFWVKKPQYRPENAVDVRNGDGNTLKLRSGYPTDPLTVRRETAKPVASETAVLHEEMEQLSAVYTEPLPGTEVLPGTERLTDQQTETLAAGTERLLDETVSFRQAESTVSLQATRPLPVGETEVLGANKQNGNTEEISETTPLTDQ